MNELTKEPVMTIKELSEALNTPTRTIHNSIDRVLPNIKSNGKVTYLNEKQVSMISNDLKRSHNVDLASTRKVAFTEKEMLLNIQRDMMWLINKNNEVVEENKNLKTEITEAKPKVELCNAVVRDTTTQYSIRDAGKHLGLRQKEIFTIMRDNKLLTQKRLPTQKALDKGVLTTKTNTVDGKNRPQAVMTMENIKNFRNVYLDEVNRKEIEG